MIKRNFTRFVSILSIISISTLFVYLILKYNDITHSSFVKYTPLDTLVSSNGVRITADFIEAVEYVEIALKKFYQDGGEMPYGVEAIVEKQNEKITVTFPIVRDEFTNGGDFYVKIILDAKTKTILELWLSA